MNLKSNPIVKRTKNGNAAVVLHRTSSFPVSVYKDGHLTISGWLLAVEGCPRSQSGFLAGRNPQCATLGKELLRLWREAGYPDLGEWPHEGVELFGHVVMVLTRVLCSLPNPQEVAA